VSPKDISHPQDPTAPHDRAVAHRMQMEARAAVREGRRLRTILQDLSDRDALHLYELAGLKPAGSTKAFLEAKRPRFLEFLEDDGRLGFVLEVWRGTQLGYAHPLLAPDCDRDFTGDDDVGPIERSRRLSGWRQALTMWLSSVRFDRPLPVEVARVCADVVRGKAEHVPDAIATRWRSWCRVNQVLEEASRAASSLMQFDLDGGDGCMEAVLETLRLAYEAQKKASESAASLSDLVTRATERITSLDELNDALLDLGIHIDSRLDLVGRMLVDAEKLAAPEEPLASWKAVRFRDGSIDTSATVKQLSGLLSACDARLAELDARDDSLRPALEAFLGLTSSLPEGFHTAGRAQLLYAAEHARDRLSAGETAHDILAQSPILAALVQLLPPSSRDSDDARQALSQLREELPGRFVSQLLDWVDALPAPDESEGDLGDLLEPRHAEDGSGSFLDDGTLLPHADDASATSPVEAHTDDSGSGYSPADGEPGAALEPDTLVDADPVDPEPETVAPPFADLEPPPDTAWQPDEDASSADYARPDTQGGAPVAAPALPPVPQAEPRLPGEARSFEEYRRLFWIAPSGRCATAPWSRPDFESELQRAARGAITDLALPQLWIFCRASEALRWQPVVASRDVDAFASIWRNATSATAGFDATRPERIRQALGSETAREAVLFAACLEALRPNSEAHLTIDEIQRLVSLLEGHSNDLTVVLQNLLRIGAQGQDPVAVAMEALSSSPSVAPAVLEKELRRARAQFREVTARLWSAAGGKIERTHCRKAWTQFIETHVDPLTKTLYAPPDESLRDVKSWNVDQLTRTCRQLVARHDAIADRGKALFQDRRRMQGAVAEIADAALGVMTAARAWRGATAGEHPKPPHLALVELSRLVGEARLTDPIEEACRRLIQRAVVPGLQGSTAGQEALALDVAEVVARPHLLSMLAQGTDLASRSTGVPVESISSPERAAAILLAPATRSAAPGSAPEHLLHELRRELREASQFHLLARLVDAEVQSAEKNEIHRQAADRTEELYSQLDRLRDLRSDIDELAPVASKALAEIRAEATHLLDETEEHQYGDLPLLENWLREVTGYAQDVLRHAIVQRLHDDATLAPATQKAIVDALARGSLHAAAERLRSTSRDPSGSALQSERITLWRPETELLFAGGTSPLSVLAETKPEASELIQLWRRPPEPAKQHPLRRALWRFISGEDDDSVASTGLRRIATNRDIRIVTTELRALLAKGGLNPTFLPQLRQFKEIVIASAPAIRGNALTRDLTRAHNDKERNLTVFLAPGMSSQTRAESLVELRRRRMPIALIDDVDLYRLVAPGVPTADGFIALMEVVLEQLDLSMVSPFKSQDGQFIQEELFVGRKEKLDEIANTEAPTRVFSGRKLGKSALLKFLEIDRDGTKLPSGNTLRVVYKVVAGGESEEGLLSAIATALRDRLRFEPSLREGDPGKRLTAWMDEFRATHPDESLLVILDEADAFVEEQLKAYEIHREKCLSFLMMKAIPDHRDSTGFPRVRFVFSGYRVTNTREGAWANAGSVLQLGPLAEIEARSLIEGSLCRIGIDVREQADAIARRCGHQPAVLIRFGEALLSILQQRIGASDRRDFVVVNAQHVMDTFDSSAVQDEIRTVVNNNFQDRTSSIIFSALLLAFQNLPPAAALEDAPRRVLEQIKGIDEDTAWLRSVGASEESEIQHALNDLVARELLREERRDGLQRYFLRYPNHLTVLAQPTLRKTISQRIATVRQGAGDAGYLPNLLPKSAMEELRSLLDGPSSRDLPITAGVVGTSWAAALRHDRGGIPDRLGIAPDKVVDVASGGIRADVLERSPLVVVNTSAGTANDIVTRRDRSLSPPIMLGDLDLLRWAVKLDRSGERDFIAVHGLRRLPHRRISWWFERVRNLGFSDPDAIDQIEQATSGIPILLGHVDELLGLPVTGGDVERSTLERVLAALNDRLPEIATTLRTGRGALTPREFQLLQLTTRAADELGDGSEMPFEDYLSDQSLVDNLFPGVDAFQRSPEDELSCAVLKLSGLLPLDDDKVVRLRPDDALKKIVRAIEAA